MNYDALILFIALANVLISPYAHSCNPIDKEALLHFKQSITADPSSLLAAWLPTTDCCATWTGVECDLATTSRVTKVFSLGLESPGDDIIDNFMSGTLSPYLGNLAYLQILDASNLKELSGPIAPELGNLSRLRRLYLQTNKLNGPLPSSLSNLHQLEMLYIADNQLSGSIPDSFFRSMTLLSDLYAWGNQLSGPIPSSIR